MKSRNNITEFVLLGLTEYVQGQKIIFVVYLLIYIVIIVGNLLIVLTVVFSSTLNSPMCFFHGYLSFMLLLLLLSCFSHVRLCATP